MKGPEMRFLRVVRNKATLTPSPLPLLVGEGGKGVRVTLLLFVFCLSGCWTGRGSCRIGGTDQALLPAGPVQARLSVLVRKGPLSMEASGDAYLVPPDTFRLEVVSPFGEMLFDLRAAGGRVISLAGQEGVRSEDLEKAFAAPGSPAISVLFTGGCGRDGVLYADSTLTVTLSNGGSGHENLCLRFSRGPVMEAEVVERRERPGLSGSILLK